MARTGPSRRSDRAERLLAEAGLDDPEVVYDLGIYPRYADRIGEDLLRVADEQGYDHVAVGHHGRGAVDRAAFGSTPETVVRGATTHVTVVP